MMNKLGKFTYWGFLILLALSMVAAGAGKLAGIEQLHASFQTMQLPIWFGYFIGFVEVIAGIGLWFTRFRSLAALALLPIMVGAAYYHLVYDIPSAVPAILFGILAGYFFIQSTIGAKRSFSFT